MKLYNVVFQMVDNNVGYIYHDNLEELQSIINKGYSFAKDLDWESHEIISTEKSVISATELSETIIFTDD